MLTCPITGFTEFLAYRAIDDDEVEIILSEDIDEFLSLMEERGRHKLTKERAARYVHVVSEMRSYTFQAQDKLRLWMWQAGVPKGFIEKFVDLIWNWRLLKYDLQRDHLSIPEVQSYPFDMVGEPTGRSFKAPRPLDVFERDIFDPLQDKRYPDSW
jgi:hypothetical protein